MDTWQQQCSDHPKNHQDISQHQKDPAIPILQNYVSLDISWKDLKVSELKTTQHNVHLVWHSPLWAHKKNWHVALLSDND